MAQSGSFCTKTTMEEVYHKVPILYIEPIQPDGTKTFTPMKLLEQFQQYTDRSYEIDKKPMITGKKRTKTQR